MSGCLSSALVFPTLVALLEEKATPPRADQHQPGTPLPALAYLTKPFAQFWPLLTPAQLEKSSSVSFDLPAYLSFF